jgi:hypothetical protein
LGRLDKWQLIWVVSISLGISLISLTCKLEFISRNAQNWILGYGGQGRKKLLALIPAFSPAPGEGAEEICPAPKIRAAAIFGCRSPVYFSKLAIKYRL